MQFDREADIPQDEIIQLAWGVFDGRFEDVDNQYERLKQLLVADAETVSIFVDCLRLNLELKNELMPRAISSRL